MRHRNMLFDVMLLNLERQLVELAHERFGKPLEQCSDEEAYYIVMELTRRITQVCEKNSGEKKVYYISTDFLPGRLLGKNLMNMGIYQRMRDVLIRYGKHLSRLEEVEHELMYGKGSMGIVTASMMDSVTMLGYPVEALGLHYGLGNVPDSSAEYGRLFLRSRNDEEFWGTRTNLSFDVELAGSRIRSRVHELNAVGYVGGINKVRLFDMCDDLNRIAGEITLTETELAKLAQTVGRANMMKLCRQYFLASNAAQMILREMKTRKYDLREFDDHAIIQICGASCGLIIPELIRILVEEKAVNFTAAVGIVISTCQYTVFASPSEIVQVWPAALLKQFIPQLMPVIYKMHKLVRISYDEEELQIIDRDDNVHMERICMHFTSTSSFVSRTQGNMLSGGQLRSFAETYPERFAVRRTGISFRTWLLLANGALTKWIGEQIGDDFKDRNEELENLLSLAEDETVLQSLSETKKPARRRLAAHLLRQEGEKLIRKGLIDVMTGTIRSGSGHEYAIRYIEHRIAMIHEGNPPARPINFIFTAGAADGDLRAAEMEMRLRQLRDNVNRDPMLSAHLRVILLENYNVTFAQNLLPAADIAEETADPAIVSAGTGKMKCMVNGVVTIGLRGGCAEEICEIVGEENIYMFTDEASYIEVKDRALGDYEDRNGWAKKMLANIAGSHHFSCDKTANAYNADIWKLS